LKMEKLEELSIQKVGLLNLTGIEKCFPNLTCLDLAKNRIFAVEAVEALHRLGELAEVSFKDNPICVHKHLTEMVTDVVPQIEVVNNQSLHEAGHRFKLELEDLKERIKGMSSEVGSYAADKQLLADDPDYDLPDEEDDSVAAKAKRLGAMFNKAKQGEEKLDKAFNDIEKNFGLRVKALNEEDENACADP